VHFRKKDKTNKNEALKTENNNFAKVRRRKIKIISNEIKTSLPAEVDPSCCGQAVPTAAAANAF
jgi:hypothetical protein